MNMTPSQRVEVVQTATETLKSQGRLIAALRDQLVVLGTELDSAKDRIRNLERQLAEGTSQSAPARTRGYSS